MIESRLQSKPPKRSSNKSFGIVMAIFFMIVGALPFIQGNPVRIWALLLGILFLIFSLLMPAALEPLNQVWFKLGLLLHKITSPIISGLMFFGIITPVGVLRRFGKNGRMNLPFHKNKHSYWIERVPPGPAADSLKDQF